MHIVLWVFVITSFAGFIYFGYDWYKLPGPARSALIVASAIQTLGCAVLVVVSPMAALGKYY